MSKARSEAMQLETEMEYIHLERDKWRFRGRRANVFDTVAGMEDRGDSPETVAAELDVPIEAIFQAIEFVHSRPDLEKEHRQRMLKFANENSRR